LTADLHLIQGARYIQTIGLNYLSLRCPQSEDSCDLPFFRKNYQSFFILNISLARQ
jgi:hypothetical protein